MKKCNFFILFIAMLFSSSCGIITKTRYGNGLKLNFELDIGKDKGKPARAAKVKSQYRTGKVSAAAAGHAIGTIPELDYLPASPGKAFLLKVAGKKMEMGVHEHIRNIYVTDTSRAKGREIEPVTAAAGILFYGPAAVFATAAILNIAIGEFLILFLVIVMLIVPAGNSGTSAHTQQ
jgi:hypothetical protein